MIKHLLAVCGHSESWGPPYDGGGGGERQGGGKRRESGKVERESAHTIMESAVGQSVHVHSNC